MKKIILCLSIIFALLAIVSCKDDVVKNTDANKNANENSNDTPQMLIEDLYFFYSTPSWLKDDVGKPPVKINPISKTITHLCTDPLCFHENATECLFFDCDKFYANKNYLFYTVGGVRDVGLERTGTLKLRVYDTTTDTVLEIAQYEDILYFEIATGSYIYYYVDQYVGDTNSEHTKIMYRADAKNGNIIEIPVDQKFLSANFASISIYIIDDDKIYWRKSGVRGQEYYSTDLEGNNIEPITYNDSNAALYSRFGKDNFADGYYYYLKMDENESKAIRELRKPIFDLDYEYEHYYHNQLMYKIPIDGSSDVELVSEHIDDFIICGDKIYYTAMEDDHKPIIYDGVQLSDNTGLVDQWNWNLGKIHVMNLDGTNKRLVCETIDERIDFFIYAKTINGVDYLLLEFSEARYTSSKNEQDIYLDKYSYERSLDLLLVNASTGEVTRLSMPE